MPALSTTRPFVPVGLLTNELLSISEFELGEMMQILRRRFLLVLCYLCLAFSVVPALAQSNAAAPLITVYKTPT